MGLSADSGDQFQGFHCDNLFIVVDEAEGVDDDIYEAIEAIMTAADPRLLLIGNPTTVSGAFRRAFYQDRHLYHTITISALDSPNVVAGNVVIPGLTSGQWVDEHRETWGEDNPIYRARILGEFPDQAEDTLIKLSDIETASRREPVAGVPEAGEAVTTDAAGVQDVVLAVDVARFGSDRSVILRRRGDRVEEIRTFQKLDTMELVGWVVAAIHDSQPTMVYVDEIGVGAGVVDRLREQGHRVKGINVARRAQQEALFANLRAQGYWQLRERFASGTISIPADNQLMGELAALRYSYDSQGRILLESKESMRQRGLPSPDKADALMLAYLEPAGRVRLWT